jgi:hypothetical protein
VNAHRSRPQSERDCARDLVAALATAAAVAGPACQASGPFDADRAVDMRDAGTVHLAVLAVAPWSEYVAALQPNFNLTADDALAKVARDSLWQLQDSRSEARAGGQSTFRVQPENQGGTGLQTPQVAGVPQNGYGPPEAPVIIPPAPVDPDSQSGADSMLKYTAASALYQEVQLLNRHVRDAAIPAGFRPYMVRLQVSLMPSRRHAPYDAYTTISFFLPGDRRHAGDAAARWVRTTSDDIFDEPFGNGPKVLPLVVTDNLESAVQARSYERVRSLIGTFLDFTHSSIIEPAYSAMLERALRDQVFGRDINSLLTVARLSENTLRIRLGAQQEATANYAMVPRNHNVTLLLMVPEGAPSLMEVVAKTVLVDAENGRALPAADAWDDAECLRRMQREWKLEDLDADGLRALHHLARQNDQEQFSSVLHASLPADHPSLAQERSLWIELVSLELEDRYRSTLFELPGQAENAAESASLFERQTVVVEDDGVHATIVLREARVRDSEQVLAVLSAPGAEPPLVLPAETVRADVPRRELDLRFPSLRRWDATPDPGLPLELDVSWSGSRFKFQTRVVSVERRESAP